MKTTKVKTVDMTNRLISMAKRARSCNSEKSKRQSDKVNVQQEDLRWPDVLNQLKKEGYNPDWVPILVRLGDAMVTSLEHQEYNIIGNFDDGYLLAKHFIDRKLF